MPFLLTSAYKFNISAASDIFVEIGLFTARNFEPVAAFSGYEEDFLILNFNEYTQFMKVLSANNSFFTLDTALLSSSQYPVQNIGEFILNFDISQLTIFVFTNNSPIFRISRTTWTELCNFRDILALKFNILEKYSIYARLLYSRFVNFISSQKHHQQNTSSGITANELLLYAPTNIIPEHKYIRIDAQEFDPTVCQLLDAEIRLFCLNDVFRDCKNLRENEPLTLSNYFTRF